MNTYRILNDAGFPSPLPRRAVPCPDEDLLSILRRSASRMHYPDLRWLLQPEGNKWHIEDIEIPLLSAKKDYDVLEHLLTLSEEDLYSHTLHRFASLLERVRRGQQPAEPVNPFTNLMRLSSMSQSTYFLPIRSIRVCPLCLQEQEGYDRLYWRLQLIFHCPHHRVRLLEKCPSCEAPITANRQSPYTCPHCRQGDFRTVNQTPPIRSDNPLYIGERLLLKALGVTIQGDTRAERALTHSPLSTLPGNSYLYFLHVITSKLRRLFSFQELVLLVKLLDASPGEDLSWLQDFHLYQSAVAFLFFHWLFLEWPSHFFAFLETWYSLSTPPFMGEEPVSVLLCSDSLFHNPINPDIDVWLHQAYQEFHQQFHPDPKRIDHLRDTMNWLAQSAYLPQRADEARSRTMRKHEQGVYIPPRFLTPTPPFPWESLGSVLSRAARKRNHPYPELLLYNPPFTSGFILDHSQGEVRLPDEAGDAMLAYFLQISKEHIPPLTGSSLITSLGLPRYNVSGYWVSLTEPDLRSWLYPYMNHTTRVCSYCVQDQQGYDRLYWNMHGVQSCPHHNVRLLKRCPVCRKPIPVARPYRGQCPFCKSEMHMPSMECLSEGSLLTAGTSLILTMLHIPSTEASDAFKFLSPSPLLTVTPDVYFALLIALTEEIGSYYAYSQQQLLQLCHKLGEDTISFEQTEGDLYALDVQELLFHTIFSHWPQRFFTFLDILYDTVRLPLRPPGYLSFRWRWLLIKRWWLITPRWLFDAFEEHERRYRESEDF